ncbi:hypothetical protein [Streptomyces sp. NPDC050988]|uniref:hypothetical protein n=1 Tax=Streptomyces sp. NPDC050988 TaxID=3365637 RepID=UPI00379F88D8
MSEHQHPPVELPEPGPAEPGVNQLLLGELTASALAGCEPCADALLDQIAADPASTARLVEITRRVPLRMYDGRLPPYTPYTPDHPHNAAFGLLAHKVKAEDPHLAACVEMPEIHRKAVAYVALMHLAEYVRFEQEGGFGTHQTLPEACVALGAGMAGWWHRAKPQQAAEFTNRWNVHWAARFPEEGAPVAAEAVLSFVLGSVLHHLAVEDGIGLDRLPRLTYSNAPAVLRDTGLTGRVLRDFRAPRAVEFFAAPGKRLSADEAFLSDVGGTAVLVVQAHVADCEHSFFPRHTCEIVHRAAEITSVRA